MRHALARRVRIVTLFGMLVLCVAGPAWATTLTFDFAGTLAYQYGTVEGSFTYESTAAPSAYNVRGLATNVIYALTSWDLTVNNTLASIPSPYLVNFPSTIAFSNLLANNTSEFCIGTCMLSTPIENVRFVNGEYSLFLSFKIPSATPFMTAPPDTLAEWGPLYAGNAMDGGAAWFQSSRGMSIITSGGMTGVSSAPISQPVPEPSTWWLVGLGVLGLLLAQFQRRLRADHFIE